eukprot:g3733.t1
MSGLDSCSYRELQARCKQLKIRAIGQKEVLIQRIKDRVNRNSTSGGKNYLNVFIELSKDILNASFDKFTERNKFYITFALITTLCLVAIIIALKPDPMTDIKTQAEKNVELKNKLKLELELLHEQEKLIKLKLSSNDYSIDKLCKSNNKEPKLVSTYEYLQLCER